MVDLPSRPLADVDPEFEKMALETGGFTYGLDGISTREKLLQNLANDVCRLQLGLAFRLHVQATAMHDIPYADLLALLRFVAPYAGYPAAADALARLGELAGELDLVTGGPSAVPEAHVPASMASGSNESNAPESKAPENDGESNAATDVARQRLATGDPWLREFVTDRTDRAWSEHRLSPRERAIIALTVDVAMQTLGGSFRLHVQTALEAGMTPDEIRDAVRFCAEMGVVKAIDALGALEPILG